MSRSEYKPRASLEQIKDRWEEVYSKYTKLSKKGGNLVGICPVHSEKSGSFNVFSNGAFKCFGCGISGGSIIDFVMLKESLDFNGALELLRKDINPTLIKTSPRKKIIKEDNLVEVEPMKFEKRHKDYWNKYLLPEKYLKENNVFALKAYAINKKAYIFPEDVAAFGYYAPEVDKWKILQIGENVERKWINWIPNAYIHRENKIGDCKELWVVKSLKDALVLNKEFGFCTVALQNESAETFIKFNAERLENKCKNIVIGLGADPQGVLQSQILTKKRGYKYFNTEKYMLKYDCEDFADVIAIFGKEPLKQLLIKKGYLKN